MEKKDYSELTKEIKQKYSELKQLLQENGITEKVFTDKFLEILVEINERLYFLLGNKSESTRKRREESIEKLYQRTIKQAINKIIEIQDNSEIELDYSLFKPGERLNGNKNGSKDMEIKEVLKYNEFLRAYYELYFGRDDINMELYVEKLEKEKMRKIPYRIIYLKGPNFGRTILISDQIGEVSFVYDGIIDKRDFKIINKGEEINGNVPHRIIYGSNYKIRFKKLLQEKFEEVNNIEDKTDEQVLNEEKEYLLQQNIIKFFKNFNGMYKEESYKYWMWLGVKDIRKIKYEGKKIMNLSKILDWKNTSGLDIRIPRGFQEFINWLFGKEKKEIFKEEVLIYFKNIKETEEESYKYWIGLKRDEMLEKEYKGKKITALATIIGWETKNNQSLQVLKGYYEFINWLFGKENKLTKEGIISYFKNYNGMGEEESYKYWMSLTLGQIRKIKYKGKGIKKLVSISTWDNKNGVNVQNINGFQKFIGYLFGKEKKEIIKEEVLIYFKNIKKIEEESYKYWMGLKKDQVFDIEHEGKKITALATIAGWKNKNNQPLVTLKGYYEFINYLFGKENKLTKEGINSYFKNYNGMGEEESYNYWLGLNIFQIREIEYMGKKIKSLGSIIGWNNKTGLNLQSVKGFQKFINSLFKK